MARVYDYGTGDDLGEATAELEQASAAAGYEGVVSAKKDENGAWVHAPEPGSAWDGAISVYVAE